MLKGKRIFISGGNGVIGNTLVKKLHQKGAILYVGDLKRRPLDWPKDIIYRQGDLNYITQEELQSFSPDYFFHLAATFERSTESYEFWEENFQHNVSLSHHLMTLLKDMKSLKAVIFASSYLIYNPELYTFSQPADKAYRLKENDSIYPRNLTGVAKLSHEIELRFLSEFHADQCRNIFARIYRSYGINSRDIISRWIRALLNNETLTVYAKEGMFDYIYANDVAEGLLRLVSESTVSGVINLGNDNARRVSKVLEILRKYFPEMKTIEVDSSISYEASQANMDYFQKMVGWKPEHQLEDVIPKLIEYEKNHSFNTLSDSENFNILVTSISRKVPLLKNIRIAANKLSPNIKIYGADLDKNCIGKYFTDSFWLMPLISELSKEDLIAYCKQNNIHCIIPTRDGELSFFAKLKPYLADHNISVMVSELDTVEYCLDKLSFYKYFDKAGFPVIKTTEQLDDLISDDNFVVKERYGAGSQTIGLNLNKSQALNYATQLEHPIFQPYIEGQEISIDVYISKNAKAKAVIARKRDVIVNGESQITTTFANKEIEQICIQLLENNGFYGHIVMQVFVDNASNLHIIECNSRFGGASTLGLAAGIDSFYWFLLESIGHDIEEYPFLRTKDEKIQIRYPDDIIINS